MGFMLPDLKNHSKSVKRFRLKNGKSWCLANEHFFFLRPWLWGDTVLYMQYSKKKSSMVSKKLNVHAARGGTAAGRHGGAAREYLIFVKNNVYGFTCCI